MNIEKIKHFKNRLEEEKEKLSESKDNIVEKKYDSMSTYSNELSGYDNHPGDLGTEVFMKEQDQGFEISIDNKLREIEESLGMIDEGSYGKCNICNRKINEERLELIPYLKTCLECAEEKDQPLEFRQYESLEDEYVSKPSHDPNVNVIYDREDTYQDLAAYNIVPGDPSMSTGDNMGLSDDEEIDGVEEIEKISQEYYDETLK